MKELSITTIMFCLGLAGYLLVDSFENEILAVELTIFLVFISNIIVIYYKFRTNVKNMLKYFSISFIFGALVGVLIS